MAAGNETSGIYFAYLKGFVLSFELANIHIDASLAMLAFQTSKKHAESGVSGEKISKGRFPFSKNSGLKFRKFYVFNGTVHSGCTDPTQATARLIRAKYKHNKHQNKKWLTLCLELLDDSEMKVDEFFEAT